MLTIIVDVENAKHYISTKHVLGQYVEIQAWDKRGEGETEKGEFGGNHFLSVYG